MMTERLLRTSRTAALLAALACLLAGPSRAPAEPVRGKHDPLVTQMVAEILQRGHLRQPEIGDEVARQLFRNFLDMLDPNKLYFLQSDVEEFKKQEAELARMLRKGDLGFPYKVYERYLKRLSERLKLVEELVEAKHDFSAKEYLDTDTDKLDYAASDAALRERWGKRIKFDLLMQRLGEKPVGEAEAKKKVLARYQGLLKRSRQADNADLLELYLNALATSIDPHSTYMSANTLADFEISLRLNLEGIGAVLRSEEGQTVVVEVVPGGAAGVDGRLKAGDKIVGVAQGDDKFVDVVDMRLRDVVNLIRGKRETEVQLKVIPAGKIEPVVYKLTRQKIELKSQEARGEVIEQGKKADGKPYLVGVIDLPSFYADLRGKGGKSATEDVRKILKEFTAKKVDGVILDIRHNGGGALSEAVALTGLFLDQGPIVQVKNSRGKVAIQDDPEKGAVYSGPLVVLTSRRSASASEILAGALQDYGRALIVGDSSTHGKGTVQAVVDLGAQLGADDPPKLGALKLTIQQFYRVNGDSTQEKGVTSDIVLPSLSEHLATTEKEMKHALAFDKVRPAEHDNLGLVPEGMKKVLQERSNKRIKASKDFDKLAQEIERLKERKASKKVPLNEKELREQLTKEDTGKADEAPAPGAAPYKFKRDYVNNEILQIMEDFLQGKKLASAR